MKICRVSHVISTIFPSGILNSLVFDKWIFHLWERKRKSFSTTFSIFSSLSSLNSKPLAFTLFHSFVQYVFASSLSAALRYTQDMETVYMGDRNEIVTPQPSTDLLSYFRSFYMTRFIFWTLHSFFFSSYTSFWWKLRF